MKGFYDTILPKDRLKLAGIIKTEASRVLHRCLVLGCRLKLAGIIKTEAAPKASPSLTKTRLKLAGIIKTEALVARGM